MRRLVVTVLATGLAVPLVAQSLGQIAERDKQRRPKGSPSPSAPAYTDTDLRASPSPSPSASPSPSPATGATAGPRPKGWKAPASPSPASPAPGRAVVSPAPTPEPPDRSEQQRAALETQWRGIARQRRETVATTEAQVAALDAKIAALRNDMSPVNLGDPNREQTRQAEITRAMAEVEAARATLAVARKAVDDLESDVVRAGGLPGWVR